MPGGMQWPNGAKCAVCLTFDFDAESLWLAKDAKNRELLATLSQGHYGAKVGVPKILELLRNESLNATFFTPGWTAETYPGHIEAILTGGHEIAHHGYMHYRPDPDDPDLIEEELQRGLEALDKIAGVRPLGYRPPGSESCDLLLSKLTDRGFLYNSCFKDDYKPYRHILADGRPGPVEIPEHPSLDDWNYGTTHLRAPKPLYPKDIVLSIWQDEFREIHDWGGVFCLVMHPQVTGRPMRLATLREFIAFTRGFDDVWYATGEQVARAYVATESGDQDAPATN